MSADHEPIALGPITISFSVTADGTDVVVDPGDTLCSKRRRWPT